MYEYQCADCGKKFEELVPINERKNPSCPSCGSVKTEKKMSVIGGFGLGGGSSCGGSGFS
ncbi:MAG: zinc ribbon domain-containing protein, partial [Chitinispirillaceae bacterium]|nr:zinc ribbon domain-containing protein [Chitinispirillaceae bacterium]